MAAPAVVSIIGLRALRRDIAKQTTQTSSAMYEGLRAAGRLAANPIADTTRTIVPRVSGRLAADVRVLASRTGASVRMGRQALRYAGFIEFGGNLPQGPHRQYIPQGRYLFPTTLRYAERSATLYSAALQKVLNNSSIWTNSSTDTGQVHD
jgi:hypothetical protein